jgi:hypothetical protein
VDIARLIPFYMISLQVTVAVIHRTLNNTDTLTLQLLGKVVKFYEEAEKIPEHLKIVQKTVTIAGRVVKTCYASLFIVFVSLTLSAAILSYYKQEFILYMPFRIPFLDPNTLIGYSIHAIYGLYLSLVAGFSVTLYVETSQIFFTLQMIAMIDILILKFDAFANELINAHEKEEIDENKMVYLRKAQNENIHEVTENFDNRLVNLIQEFKSYNVFVSEYLFLKSKYMFAVVSCNSIAIGFYILNMFQFSYVIGGLCATGVTLQVAISCTVGTMIKNQKEKFTEMIYGFPWYYLSKKDQKIFFQFVHLCQHSTEVVLTMIGNVNMELFSHILNASYSFFMYLWNFV